jgi:hypothetical protein
MFFTPEDLTEEQRMIGDTTREFVDNEVQPHFRQWRTTLGKWLATLFASWGARPIGR